jgi:uncharacterized protein YjgD (DUF1641 family)
VVPVEIARAAAQTAAEESQVAERRAGLALRDPDVQAAQDDEEKDGRESRPSP